jgi:hypothetical protein
MNSSGNALTKTGYFGRARAEAAMLLNLSMTLKNIRLPDGRLISARSEHQQLLDVLESILTGKTKMHIDDIKQIAQWAFGTQAKNRSRKGMRDATASEV